MLLVRTGLQARVAKNHDYVLLCMYEPSIPEMCAYCDRSSSMISGHNGMWDCDPWLPRSPGKRKCEDGRTIHLGKHLLTLCHRASCVFSTNSGTCSVTCSVTGTCSETGTCSGTGAGSAQCLVSGPMALENSTARKCLIHWM